jgi:hypothetical protein
MKTKMVTIMVMALCLGSSLQAMVIRNYCEDKEEKIRTESGSFNEDYLFMGPELNFSGEAEDLLFLGKRLTFDGTTKLGLFTLCKSLILSGAAGNGIMAGGLEIVVNGAITGNSYIGCKSFVMSDKAAVNGNLFVGCAKCSIDGKLNGDLYVGAGEIVINNEVRGNVTAYGGRIVIGEKGKINGNLVYSTKEKLSVDELARVYGTITIDKRHKFDNDWNTFGKLKKTSIGFFIGCALLLSYLIIGSLLLFIPAFRRLDMQRTAATFWKTSLWGLIPVLMYPAVVVLCFALVVTIPFALVLLLAIFPLFFFAYLIGATFTGKYLAAKLKWKVEKRHSQFLVGALAGAILSIIPIVNFLAFIFISAQGWGVYLSFLFKKDL